MPKKQATKLTLATRQRKQTANATSFKKGNPHAFQPGDDRINRSGKSPLDTQLLSKNLKVVLNDRAPAAICAKMGIPSTSSWSQCLSAFLVWQALKEDSWSQAFELILRFTEPKAGVMAEEIAQMGQQMSTATRIVFMESDGNGGLSEQSIELKRLIEAREQEQAQPELSEEALRAETIEGFAHQLGPEN